LFTATLHLKPVEELALAGESAETPDLILQTLKDGPNMTLAEVADAIGRSLSAVERASAKLVKTGRLKYVGPQKGGHWEALE
jgi:ATP-dependent DNA helicase RecG